MKKQIALIFLFLYIPLYGQMLITIGDANLRTYQKIHKGCFDNEETGMSVMCNEIFTLSLSKESRSVPRLPPKGGTLSGAFGNASINSPHTHCNIPKITQPNSQAAICGKSCNFPLLSYSEFSVFQLRRLLFLYFIH